MSQYKLCAFSDEADASIDGQISALKGNGIPYIELRGVDYGPAVGLSDRSAEKLKKKLDDAGISVWSMGSPMGKIGVRDPFAPHMEQFLRTLEIGNILGAKCMRMFSFYIPENETRETCRDEVMERLIRFAEEAKGSGITLCHENEKGIYGDTASPCLDIMKNVPGIKAVFDPANFIQCGQETLSAWDMLAPYVKYMHIKDALESGKVVPAGKGEGHVPEIVEKFGRQGGEVLSVEPHLAIFAGLSELEKERKSIQEDTYPSKRAAFDTAVDALKELIKLIN